jgi:anti-anti-sigma factor
LSKGEKMLAVDRIEKNEGVIIFFLKNNFNSRVATFDNVVFKNLKLGYKNFIFEFSEIYWLHAKELGYLVAALDKIKKNEGKLKLVGVSKNIKDMLEIIKLITFFEIYSTTGEAMENFQK